MPKSTLLTSWSAALIAALVGFGGTVALIVQATQTLGASEIQTASAVTALCLGIGVAGILFSIWLKMPIVLAWSTPGAALLAATASGMAWPTAIGTFVVAAILMMVVGAIPMLGKLAAGIPASVASAMLGGVLLPFGLSLFKALEMDLLLVAVLVGVFILGRQRFPLYAMLLVLVSGVAVLLLRGDIDALPTGSILGNLDFVPPTFDPRIVVSVGVPLFLVTLVSQNLPGLVVLKSANYQPSPSPLLLGTGLASLLLAPFGALGINLAAITAAICTGDDAHPDPKRRWTVGLYYGVIYLVLAAFSPLLVRLFLAMPPSALAALTGIALLVPLSSAISTMLAEPSDRDAAILTFVATASGVSLFGIGAAFWGLVIGFVALGAKRLLAKRKAEF